MGLEVGLKAFAGDVVHYYVSCGVMTSVIVDFYNIWHLFMIENGQKMMLKLVLHF